MILLDGYCLWHLDVCFALLLCKSTWERQAFCLCFWCCCLDWGEQGHLASLHLQSMHRYLWCLGGQIQMLLNCLWKPRLIACLSMYKNQACTNDWQQTPMNGAFLHKVKNLCKKTQSCASLYRLLICSIKKLKFNWLECQLHCSFSCKPGSL